MRVIVTALEERTHLLPTIPVAWALRAAGHNVTLAVPPGLVGDASISGLPVSSLGASHRAYRALERLSALEDGDDPWTGSFGLTPSDMATMSLLEWRDFYRIHVGLWWRLMNDPLIGDLVEMCRRVKPDLVLWEGFTWAGAIAANATETPHARVLSGSDLLGAARAHFLAAAGGQRRERGADPVIDWLGGRLAMYDREVDESIVQGLTTLDFLPPSLQFAHSGQGKRIPFQFIPFSGRTVLPEWLLTQAVRPRVCVTLGHSSMTRSGRLRVNARDLLIGVAAHDVDVVATVPKALHGDLQPLPPSVRLESFVPLDPLAATCSVVVNHGGAATMCTVARHGVPQLVVPDDTYDEKALGDLIQAAGAGLTLDAADVSVDAIARAIEVLLQDPAVKLGAADVRDEIHNAPPPAALVGPLEDLATSGR